MGDERLSRRQLLAGLGVAGLFGVGVTGAFQSEVQSAGDRVTGFASEDSNDDIPNIDVEELGGDLKVVFDELSAAEEQVSLLYQGLEVDFMEAYSLLTGGIELVREPVIQYDRNRYNEALAKTDDIFDSIEDETVEYEYLKEYKDAIEAADGLGQEIYNAIVPLNIMKERYNQWETAIESYNFAGAYYARQGEDGYDLMRPEAESHIIQAETMYETELTQRIHMLTKFSEGRFGLLLADASAILDLYTAPVAAMNEVEHAIKDVYKAGHSLNLLHKNDIQVKHPDIDASGFTKDVRNFERSEQTATPDAVTHLEDASSHFGSAVDGIQTEVTSATNHTSMMQDVENLIEIYNAYETTLQKLTTPLKQADGGDVSNAEIGGSVNQAMEPVRESSYSFFKQGLTPFKRRYSSPRRLTREGNKLIVGDAKTTPNQSSQYVRDSDIASEEYGVNIVVETAEGRPVENCVVTFTDTEHNQKFRVFTDSYGVASHIFSGPRTGRAEPTAEIKVDTGLRINTFKTRHSDFVGNSQNDRTDRGYTDIAEGEVQTYAFTQYPSDIPIMSFRKSTWQPADGQSTMYNDLVAGTPAETDKSEYSKSPEWITRSDTEVDAKAVVVQVLNASGQPMKNHDVAINRTQTNSSRIVTQTDEYGVTNHRVNDNETTVYPSEIWEIGVGGHYPSHDLDQVSGFNTHRVYSGGVEFITFQEHSRLTVD